MARLLKVKVGRIRIDLADPDGAARACIEPTNAKNRIRIAAAGDACLRAFGIVTALHQGALMDEIEIDNALSELYDDEADHPRLRCEAIAEVERWFDPPNVRAAVVELVEALMRQGQIDGTEAEAISDRHIA
jgi:hypothetical protein